MPNVTATPRGQRNGQMLTEFIDSVGTASVTYTYPKTQEWLAVRNIGTKAITVTVGGISRTIQPGMRWENTADFTAFSIASTNGTQAFEAVADEKGNEFDSPEGKFISSAAVGSVLSGKKVGIFGSSTSDQSFIGASVYHKLIADRTGMIVYSQARSGTELIPATADYTVDTAFNMLRQIDALPANLDFVVGMVGANDERSARTIGVFTSVATWDFYSSLHKMCQKMLDKWPDKALGIMASQYVGSPTAGTVVTLQTSAYHDAVGEVCRYYGIPFLDLAREGRTPYSYLPFKNNYVRADGLHLNAAGNLILSRRVQTFFESVIGRTGSAVALPSLVSDKFTRAPGSSVGVSDSGHTWTALAGVWGIGTNALRMVTRSSAVTGSGTRDVIVVESGQKDVTITAKQLTANAPTGIAFRVTDALNFHMLVSTATGGYQLYRVSAGVSTALITTSIAGVAGDVLMVTCTGDNITIAINGGSIFSAVDAFNNTATKHGFVSRGHEAVDLFDDFDITAA